MANSAVNPRTVLWRIVWASIILCGALLRAARLSWQPLWWDEGYSIFFATEPLVEMLRLTALDIHPPLYYALLHGWFGLLGDSGPVSARLFSVIVGIVTLPTMTWATLALWPRHRWLALLATLLLAISPIHIFYSQEVRMYGLALLLTLLSSTCLWIMQRELERGGRLYLATAGYVVTASLALLTLYYAGFVLIAQQLWVIVVNRRQRRRWQWCLGAALLVLLLQTPWWLYALPKLFVYVGDKVLADQDPSLPLWSYLWRHWLAFTSGHLSAAQPWLETLRQTIAALAAIILALSLYLGRRSVHTRELSFATLLVVVPVSVGYVVNLVYPFFPEGGERLLLQSLPYLLWIIALCVASGFDRLRYLSGSLLLTAIIAALFGTWLYFTIPRYTAHDYRPVIAAISQQSRTQDSVLALFPWQVGYWRAYSPRDVEGELLPPQPAAVGQSVLQWDEQFSSRLDSALGQGTLWFPMPLSFGSTLPKQIEEYLLRHARNLQNHWYSDATRLTAWVQLEEPSNLTEINVSYADGLTLVRAGVAPTAVVSGNVPVAVDLCWQPAQLRRDLRATLRLVDSSGHTWASRDLPALGEFGGKADDPCLEQLAFNIPVGLPPDGYLLAIGIGPANSDQLLTPATAATPFAGIGALQIEAPPAPLSPYRLPAEHRLPTPVADNGLLIHGYSGPDQGSALLAGDEVALILYLQNTASAPPLRDLYVALRGRQGNTLAGWQGWPWRDNPTSTLDEGALLQVPVHFFLPADTSAADVRLTAGFVDKSAGEPGAGALLANVEIERRPAGFSVPDVHYPLSTAPTLGTHATLIGYELVHTGASLHLNLNWQVLQPLLPPHNIFVHFLDPEGMPVTQHDGEPATIQGRAPTGSWLPGEYLTTYHEVILPEGAPLPTTMHVGLYLPATGTRLPVTSNGTITGDHIALPTHLSP